MSSSSLWTIGKSYNGKIDKEYHNSWFFSPVVWDVLLDKYMHDEIQTPYGYKKSIIGMGGAELWEKINNIMNNSDNATDRICWELSNQQIFFAKDKQVISQAIKDFLAINNKYYISTEDGKSYLLLEHIIERFNFIAEDILEIDEETYVCFVFKNTSVDDAVERWFCGWDEETDVSKVISLKEQNKIIAEFVVIEDGKITKFIDNLKYFKEVEK